MLTPSLSRLLRPAPASLPVTSRVSVSRPVGSTVFVWAVWVAMTLVAWQFVQKCGGRVPMYDDLSNFTVQMEPAFPGWSFLWQAHNEHRIPLPRIAAWLTAQAFGFKMKPMMYVDIAFLSLAAAMALHAVRTIRGQTRLADAALPLIILGIGQWENMLMAFQVGFILPIALEVVLLGVLATAGPRLSLGRSLAIGLLVFCLPLCGMPGVVVAFPLAVWLVAAAVETVRTGRGRGSAIAAGVAGLVCLALVAAYFVGYAKPPHHPAPATGLASVNYAFRVLGGAWGPVVDAFGPALTSAWPSYLGAATVVVLGIAACPVVLALRSPETRVAAAGMLAFLAGELVLFAGIGSGRAVFGPDVPNRYTTLALPVLIWSYLAWLKFGPPAIREGACLGLFLTAAALAIPNAERGWERGSNQMQLHAAVFHDIHFGVPPTFLADHQSWWLHPNLPHAVAHGFEEYRRRQSPYFEKIAPDVPLREIPAVVLLNAATPQPASDGTIRTDRLNAITVRLAIPPTPGGRAVKITYSLSMKKDTPLITQFHWELIAGQPEPVHRFAFNLLKAGSHCQQRIWLGPGVTELTILLGGQDIEFKIEQMTVLAESP